MMKKTYYFCPDPEGVWHCLSAESIQELNQWGIDTSYCLKEELEDDETSTQCIRQHLDELNSPLEM